MPTLLESLTAFENTPPPAEPDDGPSPLDDWKRRREIVRELARQAGYPRMDRFRDAWGPALWGYAISEASGAQLVAMEAALRANLEACADQKGEAL